MCPILVLDRCCLPLHQKKTKCPTTYRVLCLYQPSCHLCQNFSHLWTVAVLVDPSSQDMSRCRCLVADCGHPRKRTADKDPRCPLIESGTSAPSPQTNLGRHAKVFILRDYVMVSKWQVIRGFPWQSGETRSWLTTDIDVSLADFASD